MPYSLRSRDIGRCKIKKAPRADIAQLVGSGCLVWVSCYGCDDKSTVFIKPNETRTRYVFPSKKNQSMDYGHCPTTAYFCHA